MKVPESITQLPTSARKLLSEYLKQVSPKVEDLDRALYVAWVLTKQNYKPIKLHKSSTIYPSNPTNQGNTLEVTLGKPGVDEDGDYLNFWWNKPQQPITGDVEHVYYRKGKGEHFDNWEDVRGFVAKASDFQVNEDGSLTAKVELPDHPLSADISRRFEIGEMGISVEYDFPEDAIRYDIVDGKPVRYIDYGEITGFTFTMDPAIQGTKNG
jgi:hypothetical protein